MVFVYFLTIIITWAWLGKMISTKRVIFKKSFWDKPLLIFLASQIISTIISVDRHTSFFGYYSRFNGGLLSTICYLLLYWALVSNFSTTKLNKKAEVFLKMILSSGLLVSLYGIAERFGVDKNIWVQDVQNRVFSSLGQPNWLAAYLNILIFLNLGFIFSKNGLFKKKIGRIFLHLVFYLCLLFTRSRSGFLGFVFPFIALTLVIAYPILKKKNNDRALPLTIVLSITLLISILIGIPFSPKSKINLSFLSDVKTPSVATEDNLENSRPTDLLITPSSDIRKIVWQGAVKLWSQYPIFGTGVETFGYTYYWTRPVEHNLTSEWDFLYNKTHNEFLNFAANSGTVGLTAYLILPITLFLWIANKNRLKTKKLPLFLEKNSLSSSLLFVTSSILITNFFGFSVVAVSLLFFLLPAITAIGEKGLLKQFKNPPNDFLRKSTGRFRRSPFGTKPQGFNTLRIQKFKIKLPFNNITPLLVLDSLIAIFLFFQAINYWRADFHFARGEDSNQINFLDSANEQMDLAIELNPFEPLFYSKKAVILAKTVASMTQSGQESSAEQFVNPAIESSQKALEISPFHINLYKDQAKMWYYLAFYDLELISNAITVLTTAAELAPSDPKITYNLGLAYQILDNNQEAKRYLEKTLELKPDFLLAKEALEDVKD